MKVRELLDIPDGSDIFIVKFDYEDIPSCRIVKVEKVRSYSKRNPLLGNGRSVEIVELLCEDGHIQEVYIVDNVALPPLGNYYDNWDKAKRALVRYLKGRIRAIEQELDDCEDKLKELKKK